MNAAPPTLPEAPWYRQFWPWFLIALPASVVIASLVTIVLAVRSHDPLVPDAQDRVTQFSTTPQPDAVAPD